jgi:hypothetical protein
MSTKPGSLVECHRNHPEVGVVGEIVGIIVSVRAVIDGADAVVG